MRLRKNGNIIWSGMDPGLNKYPGLPGLIILALFLIISGSLYGNVVPGYTTNNFGTKKSSLSGQGSVIYRSYQWNFKGKEWHVSFRFPKHVYTFYHEIPRRLFNKVEFVKNEDNRKVLRDFLRFFRTTAAEQNWNRHVLLHFVTEFVRQIPYQLDEKSLGEYVHTRFPVETLVDYAGECEDKSILLAAMLDELGYDVALFLLRSGQGVYHMAVGVGGIKLYGTHYTYRGKKYYYLDAVASFFYVGRAMDNYRLLSVYLISNDYKPIVRMYPPRSYFIVYSGKDRGLNDEIRYHYSALINTRRMHLKVERDRMFPQKKVFIFYTEIRKNGKVFHAMQNEIMEPRFNRKWIELPLEFYTEIKPYKVTAHRDSKGRIVFTAYVK